MDIVFGVSMTPTTVRMVLVEGEKADGVTVDHDIFDIYAADGSATSNAAEQVVAAVLGTKESAAASGHHLKSIGVTWTRPLRGGRTARRSRRPRHRRRHARLRDCTPPARSRRPSAGPSDTTPRRCSSSIADTATMSVVADRRRVGRQGAQPQPARLRRDGGARRDGRGRRVRRIRRRRACSSSVPASTSARSRSIWRTWSPCPSARPTSPRWRWPAAPRWPRPTRPRCDATTAGLAYSQDPDGTTAGKRLSGAGRRGHATWLRSAPAAYSEALATPTTLEASTSEPEPLDRGEAASRSCSSAAR